MVRSIDKVLEKREAELRAMKVTRERRQSSGLGREPGSESIDYGEAMYRIKWEDFGIQTINHRLRLGID